MLSRIVSVLAMGILCVTQSTYAQETANSFRLPLDNYPLNDGCFEWGNESTSSNACFAPTGQSVHVADDACVSVGTTVYAVANGRVKFAGTSGDCMADGWGWLIVIEHIMPDASRVCSIYGHCVPQGISVGTDVGKGDPIGNIADCSTDHIHFGIYNAHYEAGKIHGYLPKNDPPSEPSNCATDYPKFPGSYVDPIVFVNDHQGPPYHCQYVDQNVNVVSMNPGETMTFWIDYNNDGSATWSNVPGSPNYVELVSVTSGGDVKTNSFLYHSSWIDPVEQIRVGPADQNNVGYGKTARFSFTGQVPSGAVPGSTHFVYFRLESAASGLMDDWAGVNVTVNVDSPPGPCGPLLPSCNPSFAASMQSLAAAEDNTQRLGDLPVEQWRSTGRSVEGYVRAGGLYRIGFEYRSPTREELKCGLGSSNKSASGIEHVLDTVSLVSSSENWHPFWSKPFSVTPKQLSDSPILRFAFESGAGDRVEIRNVLIWSPEDWRRPVTKE